MKPFFIKNASLLLLAGISGFQSFAEKNKLKKPNVVFIICDDLNDYQGAFSGHKQVKTPNIDKLAKSGVTFINAHSNCPVCSPSRNSLFTGIYPHKSKDFGWTSHLNLPGLKNNKTIMELFAENGYHVMGSGKLLHHHHKESWHEWGIDINNYGPFAFDGKNTVGHPSVPEPFRSIGPVDGSFAPLSDVPVIPDSIIAMGGSGWVYSEKKGDYMTYVNEENRDLLPDEMHAKWAKTKIQQMEEEQINEPFFMGIGFVRPHTPLYAPKRFFDMFPVDEIELPEILADDAIDTYYKDIYPQEMKGLRYYKTLKESYGGNADLGLKHFLQAYLACIAFVDEQIGIVVDAINNSEFKDNTIIILTSDHGWQMGEKDFLFKNSPWEESTRVPLIIKSPEAANSREIGNPVSLIDIYPTLVELCSLTGDNRKELTAGKTDGYSLIPFLKSEPGKWKGPKGVLTMLGVGLNSSDATKQTYSYRTKDWRYILYLNGNEELYHNKVDPFEWNNLASDEKYSEEKKQMKNELAELLNNP